MTFSGPDENADTNYDGGDLHGGLGMESAVNAGWTPPLYPRMHLLPSGKVFYSGPSATELLFQSLESELEHRREHETGCDADLWQLGFAAFDAGQQLRPEGIDSGRRKCGDGHHRTD